MGTNRYQRLSLMRPPAAFRPTPWKQLHWEDPSHLTWIGMATPALPGGNGWVRLEGKARLNPVEMSLDLRYYGFLRLLTGS